MSQTVPVGAVDPRARRRDGGVDREQTVRIVCVGAGPAAAMLLERIVASRGLLAAGETGEAGAAGAGGAAAAGCALQVQLVDPHPPGGGRIWRRNQSPLLKLNSMLEDVAFFTDASCTVAGPVTPGYSLAEWVRAVREGEVDPPEWADEALLREIATVADRDFPTRRLNNAYLSWAFAETLRRGSQADSASGLDAAPRVVVEWVEGVAVAVAAARPGTAASEAVPDAAPGAAPDAAPLTVRLASGAELEADIVVYALGHSGTLPSNESIRLGAFADRHGLSYVAPAFTADLDLDWVVAGSDVIVRGMGLAATDLIVLLTEGRGGRFVRDETGELRYAPSGREPVVHLGSRRGVPYRSKITSRIVGEPVALEYLGRDFHAELRRRDAPLDFERDVWPLVSAELLTGYYRELFTGHPDRVSGSWDEFAPLLRRALTGPGLGAGRGRCPGGGGAAGGAAAGVDQARRVDLLELIAAWVPRVSDRFDLDSFDRPLAFAGTWAGAEAVRARGVDDAAVPVAVHQRVRAHIVEDLRQRTNQEHSATQALFMTELYAYLSLAEVPPELWNARSRTRSLPRDWHAYFSYLASGPPAHRLEELVALADAGVVRFLGADLELVADEASGRFHAAGSAATRDGSARSTVIAGALIDAWLPEARAASSDNPLLRALIGSGRARELSVADAGADSGSGDARDREVLTTGQIEVGRDGGLPGSTREFALGPFVAGPYAGAFTRPGLDSLPFRVHDRLARAVLRAAAEVIAGRTAASSHLPAS